MVKLCDEWKIISSEEFELCSAYLAQDRYDSLNFREYQYNKVCVCVCVCVCYSNDSESHRCSKCDFVCRRKSDFTKHAKSFVHEFELCATHFRTNTRLSHHLTTVCSRRIHVNPYVCVCVCVCVCVLWFCRKMAEQMIPFLYPIVQSAFDSIFAGIFFDAKAFLYPIVDSALRGQYVNGVPVFTLIV